MRKIYLFFISLLFLFSANAQVNNDVLAKQLVSSNADSIGFSKNDKDNYIVSHSFFNESAGTQMVYLNQSYKGLPVYNQVLVLAFKNGKLIYKAGSFLPDMERLTNGARATPSVAPADAVRTSISDVKESAPAMLAPLNTIENGKKYNFGKLDIAAENVIAELMWVPVEDAQNKITAVKLVWQVQLYLAKQVDYWHVRVDANTNQVVNKNSLTVSENFGPANPIKMPAFMKVAPTFQNTLTKAGAVSSNTQKNLPLSPSLVGTANYTVIPWPAESPIHAGGTAAVRTNPWTLAGGNAVSLGWHNDGAVDYTTSRGNNVWAQEDRDNNNATFGITANSTTTPDPLNFTYAGQPNYTVAPETAGFQQFALTNLFYWNNLLHDLTYNYGFTEPARNFQNNNQGRGGNQGDYVIADGQDAGGINNANMATPADGNRPRMQMYFWDPTRSATTLTINTPPVIAGNYTAVEGAFSTANLLANVGPVTGQVVWYNDDAAGNTHYACNAPNNNITGKIALIMRGFGGAVCTATVPFTTKVKNAQTAGAIAVIMVNNVGGAPIVMGGGPDNTITIPAVMVSDLDGALFAAQLANNVNATLSGTAPGTIQLDGDLDNGVIAHEFFHGVSNRLTGTGSGCLGNQEQAGEGWSDYMALIITTNWATATVADGFNIKRPIGNYASGYSTTGPGIRTHPYSTNMAINPLTYSDLPTAVVPHGVGTVFCTALWEMTWQLIQTAGISTNIWNPSGTGGNVIAFRLVMEGLKLQPCSPGFLDARNAIIQADINLYGGAHVCQIWTAFAKRGMGFSALQGSSGSTTDGTAAFDMPPTCATAAPLVTINQAATQADPTSGSPIVFTAVFDQTVTGFATGDVTLSGTAGGPLTATVVPVSGSIYTINVTGMSSTGTVIATIPAGVCQNAAAQANVASTSTDNTVTYNFVAVAPTCTINQAAGQADPTGTSPINFTAVFDQPVTGFATGDVVITGTAGATIGVVTGGPTTYNVAVSNMTGTGTVIANIPAGVCQNASAQANTAATFTDNIVNYNAPAGCTSVNPIPSDTVCNGATHAAVVFTSPTPGTTFSWTNNTPSIGLAASGTGNIPAFTATNATTAPVTATIIVTPTLTTVTPTTTTFNFTGGAQTFTVPAGVTSINLTTLGAQGGSGATGGNGATGGVGGLGSRATGTLAVTPGQVLTIFVGGQGGSPTAGFNGGGTGGNANSGGGGGASDVRFPGASSADRILVAAGGGGGGRAGCEPNTVNGGAGGNGDGNGADGAASPSGGGGFGAIGVVPGLQGIGCAGFLGSPGLAGFGPAGGNGGAGQACCCFTFASVPGGGGGGGGFLGGAGGGGGSAGNVGCTGNDKGGGGGGAGGVSNTGGVTAGAITTGVQSGNGQVVLNYNVTTVCTGPTRAFTITVNPTPTVNAIPNQTVCAGSPTTAVNFTGTPTGVTYSWTNNTPAIGLAASGTGNIPSFIAQNPGATPLTATITVTPSTGNTSAGPVTPTPEILHYRFDGVGATVPNLASAPPPGSATATIVGNQTQGSTGQCGTALIGAGGAANANHVNTNWNTNFTSAFTMSFWIGPNQVDNNPSYLFGNSSAASVFRAFYGGAALANNMLLRGGSADILINGVNPGATLVTVVYNGTNTVVYKNGGSPQTYAVTFNTSAAAPFLVGGYNSASLSLTGRLDEFRLYNRALSAAEVATLTNCTPPAGPPAVVCTGTPRTFTITVNPNPAIVITADPGTTLCEGDPTLLTVVTGSATSTGVLYTQTGAAGNSPNSQAFEPANVAFNNQAAEDFVVPVGATWTITQVSATGLYFNGAGPSTSFNVFFYNNAGGIPGSQIAAYNNLTYTGGASPVINIPNTVLPAGTYWVSIQSNMSFAAGGQWAWGAAGTTATGNPWAWQNPGGGFAVCPSWGNGAVTCIPGSGRNLLFTLTGTSASGGAPLPAGYTFLWSPAAGLSSTTSNPVAASPMNTTTYTVVATGPGPAFCSRTATVTITVNKRPVVTTQPANQVRCVGNTATFTVGATGTGLIYQWQMATSCAGPWTNVPNAAPYSGANAATLNINPVTQLMSGTVYRVIVTGVCSPWPVTPPTNISNCVTLTVNPNPVVSITPAGPVCGGVPGINGTLLSTATAPPPIPGNASANSGAINIPIPDGTGAAATSNLTIAGVPANATITEIKVNMNINHTWVGDVDVNLRAPNNAILNLVGALDNGAGGNNTDNFTNTTFSSLGGATISGAPAPRTNTYAAEARAGFGPTGFIQTVTSWTGLVPTATPTAANGTWTLAAGDFVGTDIGAITNWSISIDYTTPGTGTGPVLSYVWSPLAGLFTNSTATVAYTGTNTPSVYAAPTTLTTYTVTATDVATGCFSTASVLVNYTPPAPTVTPNPVTMCLGDPAVRLIASSSQAFTQTFNSGTLALAIPDGPASWPQTLFPGVATPNLAVSGIPAGATITGMSVKLNLTHTYIADMVIVLKAPNGNVFNIDANVNRTGGAGANFINTVISSASATPLSAGAPPYTGTFAPDAVGATYIVNGPGGGNTFPGGPTSPAGYIPNVANFSGLYSVPNGNWTLGMYDWGAGDLGVLTNWELTINYVVGVPSTPATWSPIAGLFNDAAASIAYTGDARDTVWTKPASTTTYQVTVQSLPAMLPTPVSFTNPAPVAIPIGGVGNPYPSNLTVSGLPTTGTSVHSVLLNGINHTWGEDVDVMLQSPSGQNVILMSDVGGIAAFNATYTFADSGPAMSITGANATGTYRPTNNGTPDNFPAPGPGSITQATPTLASFTGDMNGVWKLFAFDDDGIGDAGSIAGGYTIRFNVPLTPCTSPARSVLVTVNTPTTLNAQLPANQTICTDKVATFTVAVTAGTGPHTYQWQVSTNNGGTWTNITNGGVYSGATTATLTITAPPVSFSGYQYRAIVNGAAPCAAQTSRAATLTVNPLPVVVISATATSLMPGMTSTLSSTVTPNPAGPGGYSWIRNGTVLAASSQGVLSGIGTGTLVVDVDGMGDYQLRVTDVNGCTNISNTVTIKDSASGKCFIYPNPTSGKFQVRYYSVANNVLPRSLTIYDSKGDRVLTQMYTIGRPYDRMDVDMRAFGKGLYWVEIGDLNGNRITMCRVVIQ